MNCLKCGETNVTKAQFCKKCGREFSDEERDEAYEKTVYGKIEKLEKLHGYISLEAITTHPAFRIAVLVLILIWGLYVGRPHGNHLTILESDNYQVQQNEVNEDFYVLTERNTVTLRLYFPEEPEMIRLQICQEGEVLEEKEFVAEDAITVERSLEVSYRVEAEYGKKTEDIHLYVINEE